MRALLDVLAWDARSSYDGEWLWGERSYPYLPTPELGMVRDLLGQPVAA